MSFGLIFCYLMQAFLSVTSVSFWDNSIWNLCLLISWEQHFEKQWSSFCGNNTPPPTTSHNTAVIFFSINSNLTFHSDNRWKEIKKHVHSPLVIIPFPSISRPPSDTKTQYAMGRLILNSTFVWLSLEINQFTHSFIHSLVAPFNWVAYFSRLKLDIHLFSEVNEGKDDILCRSCAGSIKST